MITHIVKSLATHITICFGSNKPECNCEGCYNQRILDKSSEKDEDVRIKIDSGE